MAGKARTTRYDFGVTLGGVLFLGAMALIGLAAVNTQRALLFGLFGLLAGTFFVAVWLSRRMLAGVSVWRDVPQRVFANEVVYLGYRLHNRRRGSALGLEVREVRPPGELESVGACCVHLPGGSEFRSGSRFLVRRRGRFALSVMRIGTRFPFSLLSAYRDVVEPAWLVVWPGLGRLRTEVLVRGASEVSDMGPARGQSGSDEFFGLREYRPGDNPRWIHWKRSAAAGWPVVREMSKPPPEVLLVLLDTRRTGDGAADGLRRERLIRFAATLVEHAFRREYRVGLGLAMRDGVRVVAPGGGKSGRAAVLDALADVDDNRRRGFAETLAALPRRFVRDAHVVAIGDGAEGLGDLTGLRGACRRLTIVTSAGLDSLFQDAPGADRSPSDAPTPIHAR